MLRWFRRCRCTRCNDLQQKLDVAERSLKSASMRAATLESDRDRAREEADDNLAAWQKASDERDELQRMLNEIVEIAQGTEP